MPSDAFWEDFSARAQLHPQHSPSPVRYVHTALRWGLTAACCLIALSGAGIWQLNRPHSLSRIDTFEVAVPHEAVMILTDSDSESTLLWIVGMDGSKGV